MEKNETVKTMTLLLGILGGFFIGCLITLFAIVILSSKFHWFEGMSLMLALILLVPAGGIITAMLTGIVYNNRLKIILAGDITRKKELTALIVIPALFILINIFPKFSNLYHLLLNPAQTIPFTDAMNRVFYSTSELNKPQGSEFGEYGPQNLFDGDNTTCWTEGVNGPGIGESVYLDIQSKTQGIFIVDGYAKSKNSFKEHNRVQQINLTLYSLSPPKKSENTELHTPMNIKKESFYLTRHLKDISTPQKINFPKEWQNIINKEWKTVLKLEIVSAYNGSKYDYTCLSEITFF